MERETFCFHKFLANTGSYKDIIGFDISAGRIPYADCNPYIRGSRWVLADGVVYRVATYPGSPLAA